MPGEVLGADSDKLLADLVLTDRSGINLVRSRGKREISCGYMAQDT